nr:hypothetical protein OG781_08900 [Streptomyces sp. NBC_00830]
MPNALPPQEPQPCLRPDRRAVDFADKRINSVLRGLTDWEAALALAWARSGDSWGETAVAAGLPPAAGERVRRKLKRLGARYTERSVERTFTEVVRPFVARFKEMLG